LLREVGQEAGLGQQRLIGSRWSSEAFTVRELLERNLVPFTWHDLATDADSRILIEGLGIGEAECPVLVRSDSVIRRATVRSVADELGLRAQVDGQSFDVVVTTNSGYPLDQNLYQAVKGMSAAAQVVKDGGVIICAAECRDGLPAHGSYGAVLASAPTPALEM